MSSDTEIYIKTEMDDSQEIKIENIEQFIKAEVDENVAFNLTKKFKLKKIC